MDDGMFIPYSEEELRDMSIRTGLRQRLLQLMAAATRSVGEEYEALTVTPENICTEDGYAPIAGPSYQQFEPSIPPMAVRAWIQEYDSLHRKKLRLEKILDSGVVPDVSRRELVRIVCSKLIEIQGNLYPPTSLKLELSKAIIADFPKLKSSKTSETGYEHFFDPKTCSGFIEYRLKTMRVNLTPSEKRRTVTSNMVGGNATARKKKLFTVQNDETEECLPVAEFQTKICELQVKDPQDINKAEIFKLMDETRANRQREFSASDEHQNIDEVLFKYPRFKDYAGELIHREFAHKFKQHDYFVDKFITFYVPRILKYTSLRKPYLLEDIADVEDDNLKALVLLPELLPFPAHVKRKMQNPAAKEEIRHSALHFPRRVPNKMLLRFVKNYDELSAEESFNNNSNHPLLLCWQISSKERGGEFYIRTNSHIIHVGRNAVAAMDTLLKMHCVMNVEFAPELINFYDFLTACILKLRTPRPCCISLETCLEHVLDE